MNVAQRHAMLRAGMENDQRFELLADLGAMIAGEVELDDMLATFAARVARALGADRATLWLIDAATGDIRSRVATLPELAELRVPAGRGLVGHVAATGELVNVRDAASDPRWGGEELAQQIGYRTTSMLTAPIERPSIERPSLENPSTGDPRTPHPAAPRRDRAGTAGAPRSQPERES